MELIRSLCILAIVEHAGALLVDSARLLSLFATETFPYVCDLCGVLAFGCYARSLGECTISHDPTVEFFGHDDANAIGWLDQILGSNVPRLVFGKYYFLAQLLSGGSALCGLALHG